MKEFTNEEIEKLAGLVSTGLKPAAFSRLIAGDLSHIGRGILEGRKVAHGCDIYVNGDGLGFSHHFKAKDYSLEPIKEYHHGSEPINGLAASGICSLYGDTKSVTMRFHTRKQANEFASGLVMKDVE